MSGHFSFENSTDNSGDLNLITTDYLGPKLAYNTGLYLSDKNILYGKELHVSLMMQVLKRIDSGTVMGGFTLSRPTPLTPLALRQEVTSMVFKKTIYEELFLQHSQQGVGFKIIKFYFYKYLSLVLIIFRYKVYNFIF